MRSLAIEPYPPRCSYPSGRASCFLKVASRQYYGQLVYEMNRAKGQPGFVKRGRFATLSADDVNRLVGFDLLAF